MASLVNDRLREALVVLSPSEEERWADLIERSGRLKTTLEDLLDRVRLSFGVRDREAQDRLRRAIEKDSAPPVPRDAEQLLSVLAACQLVELFGAPRRTSTAAGDIDAAALAVRCLSRGTVSAVLPELADLADARLRRRGTDQRQLPAGVPLPDTTLTDIEVPAATPGDWNTFMQSDDALAVALARLRDEVAKALGRLARHAEAAAKAELILGEQQQMLWWISSTPLRDAPWDSALQAARELEVLTRVTPGPAAAEQLLRRRVVEEVATLPADERPSLQIDEAAPWMLPFMPLTTWLLDPDKPKPRVRSIGDVAAAYYDELLLGRLLESRDG
jgi:hypothetical protein